MHIQRSQQSIGVRLSKSTMGKTSGCGYPAGSQGRRFKGKQTLGICALLCPLTLGVLVILANDQPNLHGSFRGQIDKLETHVKLVRKAHTRIDPDADIFRRLVDGKTVNLVLFVIYPVRLHHEAATGELAQNPGPAVLGIQHQYLRLVRNIYAFEFAFFFHIFYFRWCGFHCIFSPNALTGSISTGTSFMFARADFNSEGMESYLLNHCSARFRSPVASISSNSLARLAIAACILMKSIAYLPVWESRLIAPCSAR